MFEDVEILFFSGLAIIDYLQEKVLKESNTMNCALALKENLHLIPVENFIKLTMQYVNRVSPDKLTEIRERAYVETKKELQEVQFRKDIANMLKATRC